MVIQGLESTFLLRLDNCRIINNFVELVIKGREQHVYIISTATKNVIPVNIGKIIIEANSREFWVVAKFNSFAFVFIYRWFYDTNRWKMVANIRNNPLCGLL